VESVWGIDERKEMIEWEEPEKEEARIPIKRQCQLLSLSRSTAYYRPLGASPEEIRIKNLIDRIYTAEPTYGARRISNTLKTKYGENTGRKKARTYMREMGIDAIYPGPNLSKRCKQHYTYPYFLRKVPIMHNNHVWGIDLSYIGTETGFMYLVAIVDWHSRFVVGWSLSNTMNVGFVKKAIEKAFQEHGTPLIMNSDQGSHFTCPAYIDLLKSKESIKISMNGKGRATDNAITERFFRNLKQEELYREEVHNGKDAYRLIDNYIRKYNWDRGHQSLGYRTPAQVYLNLRSEEEAE
jgi:putative transposase